MLCFLGDAYRHPACTGAEPTGSQTSVVSGPNAKATGHNSLASVTQGPNATAEATANHASAEAATTSAEAAHGSAEATANHA